MAKGDYYGDLIMPTEWRGFYNPRQVILTHNQEAIMAKGQSTAHRQKQANHFQELINNAQAILDDPATDGEEKDEATETIADMQKNLKRLSDKYGVTPTA